MLAPSITQGPSPGEKVNAADRDHTKKLSRPMETTAAMVLWADCANYCEILGPKRVDTTSFRVHRRDIQGTRSIGRLRHYRIERTNPSPQMEWNGCQRTREAISWSATIRHNSWHRGTLNDCLLPKGFCLKPIRNLAPYAVAHVSGESRSWPVHTVRWKLFERSQSVCRLPVEGILCSVSVSQEASRPTTCRS